MQAEYLSERRGTWKVAETYCGRKRTLKAGFESKSDDVTIIAGMVDCQSCLKAMAAGAS